MTDVSLRELERLSAGDDAQARTRLTIERLRHKTGVMWLWIAKRGGYRINLGLGSGLTAPETRPRGPDGCVEVTLHGYVAGGEIVVDPVLETLPPAPAVKRAWVMACLSVESAVFDREPVPVGVDVQGPLLLDLKHGVLVDINRRPDVSIRHIIERDAAGLPKPVTCDRCNGSGGAVVDCSDCDGRGTMSPLEESHP